MMTTPQEMIVWLDSVDVGHYEVAKRLGCSQPTIWRISKGKQQPSYDLGLAIRELYDQVKAERSAA